MARYRYPHNSTSRTRKRFDFALSRIGQVWEIQFKRYRGRYGMLECVFLKGTLGTARLGGVCWGYSGEGPRGLVELLRKVGISQVEAETLVFETPRLSVAGIDRLIKMTPTVVS